MNKSWCYFLFFFSITEKEINIDCIVYCFNINFGLTEKPIITQRTVTSEQSLLQQFTVKHITENAHWMFCIKFSGTAFCIIIQMFQSLDEMYLLKMLQVVHNYNTSFKFSEADLFFLSSVIQKLDQPLLSLSLWEKPDTRRWPVCILSTVYNLIITEYGIWQ